MNKVIPPATSAAIKVCEQAIALAHKQLTQSIHPARKRQLLKRIEAQVRLMLMAISIGTRQDSKKQDL